MAKRYLSKWEWLDELRRRQPTHPLPRHLPDAPWPTCDQCGEDHRPGECPRGSFFTLARHSYTDDIFAGIEAVLARIRGQRDTTFINEKINEYLEYAYTEGTLDRIRERYRDHPVIGDRVVIFRPAALIGHNQSPPLDDPLTDKQKSLVLEYRWLVLSLASEYGSGNPVLKDELHTFGLDKLDELVREYDPNFIDPRNPKARFTFGAFAKGRLRGAMRDYAKRSRRISSGSIENDAIDRIEYGRTAPRAKSKNIDGPNTQWSSADRKTGDYLKGRGGEHSDQRADRDNLDGARRKYLEAGGTIKRKTPPLIEGLRELMTEKQWDIYKARILDDPPVPIAVLAARHGIHEQNVSRTLNQALKRIKAARRGD